MPKKVKNRECRPKPAKLFAEDFPSVDPKNILKTGGRNRFLVLLSAIQELKVRVKKAKGGKWDRGNERRDARIRQRRKNGDRVADIAKDEKLSRQTVYTICKK